MTTPFKSLSPFSPRFFEMNYVAPAGACCVGFEIDAGPDLLFMPNGFGTDSPLQLNGHVTRGTVDSSNQGIISWTMISGPASVTIDDADTLTPTVHFNHYMGPFVFRMTFNSSEGIISDDVTVFVHKYSLDSLGVAGWNTLIGGVAPKSRFYFWNITGPDQRRYFAGFDDTYVGDEGNGTPYHPGDEVGYGDLDLSLPIGQRPVANTFGLNSALAQQFFATVIYNVPDGMGGEKTIEMPVDLIEGGDPDVSTDIQPPNSGPDTTYFLIPLDDNGFPVFPLSSPIAPATTIEWRANGTPHGYRVSDYRVAQVRNHAQHITPLSPELPHG